MLDRTGEPIEPDENCCRNGWLTPEDADLQIACPRHRPPPTDSVADDDPTSHYSAAARAAIEKANRND